MNSGERRATPAFYPAKKVLWIGLGCEVYTAVVVDALCEIR